MSDQLRRTPLHEVHEAAGARMINFAGWDMPVWYEGATDEHQRVRSGAGLFDLSHMAELFVIGPGAAAALDWALLLEASAMPVGRARYSMMCNHAGGIIDDLIVYRLAEHEFMVVANASNGPAVLSELRERCASFDANVSDRTDDFALVAVQGPDAERIVDDCLEQDLASLRYYRVATIEVEGETSYAARTGYTGEDGFELFVPASVGVTLWNNVLDGGGDAGPIPVGLAARDTLRLEAGMPLYGNELTLETTPFDVGASRLVTAKPGGFVGSDALADAAEEPHHSLIGLKLEGRRPARTGYQLLQDGRPVGTVTSGALSPTLGELIAIARVHATLVEGESVTVDVRGVPTKATVVNLPFYRRPA